MFNDRIINTLRTQDYDRRFITSGEPDILRGGMRYRAHPLALERYAPTTLATGGFRQDELNGGSIKSVGRALGKAFKPISRGIKTVATDIVYPIVKKAVVDVGSKWATKKLGEYLLSEAPAVAETALMVAAGRQQYHPRVLKHSLTYLNTHIKVPNKVPKSDSRVRRGALIKKIMVSRGVKLGEASKIIKVEGLKY